MEKKAKRRNQHETQERTPKKTKKKQLKALKTKGIQSVLV